MLTLYTTAHEKVCALTNYSDLYVEQAVSNTSSSESITLDQLHFKYPLEDSNNAQIQYECYIATDTDEYIVKEINKQTSDSITWVEYVCDLNVEPLKGTLIDNFAPGNVTADAAGNLALAGTGWTVGYCDVTRVRAAAKTNCTAFEALEDIAKAYSAEITFDTKNKKVNIHVKLGADRGAYFAEQLNLKKLQIQGSSRSYCTRLYPIGKNGLTIESVNAGVKYVSNYQYSTKIVSAYWIDNRYTSAADLMADAQERLDILSKPVNAYSADIVDLANTSQDIPINLFDPTTPKVLYNVAVSNIDVETGSITVSSTISHSYCFVRYDISGLTPGANYYFSATNTKSDNAYTQIHSTSNVCLGQANSTFTAPADGIIEIYFRATRATAAIDTVTFSNIQLERGTVKTGFIPYGQTRATKQYSLLDFSIGDMITLISESTGTNEQQRIVKIDRYLDEPEKTTCEIANRIVSLDDIVLRVSDAADTVSNTTDNTGAVQGNNVQVKGTDGTYSTLNTTIANIGTLVATKANITDLNAANANISNLQANKVDTTYLTANYITANSISSAYATIDNLNAATARIGTLESNQITTDYLSANYANIDLSNIGTGIIKTAMIADGAVQTAQIADGSITNAKVVDLTADKITAGTLSTDRLVITGSDKSIVYTINNINGTAQLSQSTIDGGSLTQRSITADKIVTGAITANEIASATITANNIAANTITAGNIAAGTITADKLDVNGLINALNVSTDVLYAQKLTTTGSSVYGTIGDYTTTLHGSTTSTTYTGLILRDTDGMDLFHIASGNYGDQNSTANIIKATNELDILVSSYYCDSNGNITEKITNGIYLGSNDCAGWVSLWVGDAYAGVLEENLGLWSKIFDIGYKNTELIATYSTGQTKFLGTVYPQVYGNGTVLQLCWTDSSSSGLVLESAACRPANGGWPLGTATHRWGQITSTNSVISTSDLNEKNSIEVLDSAKAKNFVMGLIPKTYKFNDGTSGRTHWGLGSQDVESELTSLGMTTMDFAGCCKDKLEDGTYRYGLRYEEFIAPTIAVVQDHEKRIETLEQAIAGKAA